MTGFDQGVSVQIGLFSCGLVRPKGMEGEILERCAVGVGRTGGDFVAQHNSLSKFPCALLPPLLLPNGGFKTPSTTAS